MAFTQTSRGIDLPIEKPLGLKAWFVWGIAVLFYCYEFLLQVSPDVLAPELSSTFHVNAEALGQLAAYYFYAYALMQLPVGLLVDRFSTRTLICIAILICAMGSLFFSQAESLAMAKLGRLLTGIGSAFAVISCLKLATQWFPYHRFALVTGLMMTVGMTGAIFGEAPLALLVDHFNWRYSMLLLGCAGLLLSVLMFLCVRDRPKNAKFMYASEPQQINVFKGLKVILRCPQTWIVSIYGCLMYASVAALGALWGVSFLVTKYTISHTAAASIISLLFVGFAIGAPLLGWFTDYLGRRKPLLYMGTTGTLITLCIFIYAPLPKEINAVSLFACGFFLSAFLPSFTILKEISPMNASGTALAFMNMLNMTWAALVQPLIGLILDYYWQGVKVNDAPVYALTDFMMALSILPVLTFLSLLLLPFIKETYCTPKVH